jgi:tetratricopeptide (TPR) repeat protein
VLLASAGAFVLVLNLALFGWFRIRAAEHERDQAQRFDLEQLKTRNERSRAAEKEQISRTLADFVVKLFQSTDPLGLENRGFSTATERMNMIAALRMLEVGVEQINQPLELGSSGALVRATLVDTFGNALRATADFRRARPLLEEALRIRNAALPGDDTDVATSLFHLAMLDHFSGRLEAAQKSYAAAIAILKKDPARHDVLLDKVEFHQAWSLAEMKNIAEAGAIMDGVLQSRRRRLGPDHVDTKTAQFASTIIKLGFGDREVLLRELVKLSLSKDPFTKAAFQYLEADALRKRADRTRLKTDVELARRKLEDVLVVARTYRPPRHFLRISSGRYGRIRTQPQ